MAKIVYGISGCGSGHSSRAREIMSHLQEKGHEILGVSYDRGYRNLKDDFNMFEVPGLHIVAIQNRVSKMQTAIKNLKSLTGGIEKFLEFKKTVFSDFQPDIVLCDFEPLTAYMATHRDLPLVTIDNQHRMRYMEYPCPSALKKDAIVAETVIRAFVPKPDVSLVTTFFFGDIKNERTFLFPPILRKSVLDARASNEGHILVYLTQQSETIIDMFRNFPRERFLIYGADCKTKEVNLSYKPFSLDGFLDDLASSKAVISTAGFTLMTEALHLGKPMLALPMGGQFEQELNAHLLEDLNYGKNGRNSDTESISDFLYRLPEYRSALENYPAQDNREIFAKLDALLFNDCELAKEAHKNRKNPLETINSEN